MPLLSDDPSSQRSLRPLISVHFPKSGGSAFRSSLGSAVGINRLLSVYDSDPLDSNNPMWIAPSWFMNHRPRTVAPYHVVHGHIPIAKYDLIPDAIRIVMLREPVENLVSIYYFWRELYTTDLLAHATYEFAKAHDLTLLEFAEMPLLRRLMSRSYFGGYDMSRFDLIGVHDRREAFRAAVASLMGLDIPAEQRENVTPHSQERCNVMCDGVLLRKLRCILDDDVRFFEELGSRFA